jgi:hypothetical protein
LGSPSEFRLTWPGYFAYQWRKRIWASLGLPHPRAVISFPKSGRTWLRVMLDELGIPALYTHAGADHRHAKLLSELNTDLKFRRGVLLLRDPRDTVVCGFHHTTKRLHRYDGTISDFFRDPRHGIEKCAKFNLMWREHARGADNMMIASYEAMHRDAAAELRRITDFFGRRRSNALIEETVQKNSFDRMQSRERDGSYLGYKDRLKPGDPRDIDSYNVRRGKVGGYRTELADSDIDYCNSVLDRLDYFRHITDRHPSSVTDNPSPPPALQNS